MKSTSKGGAKVSGKPVEVKKDRKSGSGYTGSAKKGGHGGKFTWAGTEEYSPVELGINETAVDVNDPMYDEPETVSATTTTTQ